MRVSSVLHVGLGVSFFGTGSFLSSLPPGQSNRKTLTPTWQTSPLWLDYRLRLPQGPQYSQYSHWSCTLHHCSQRIISVVPAIRAFLARGSEVLVNTPCIMPPSCFPSLSQVSKRQESPQWTVSSQSNECQSLGNTWCPLQRQSRELSLSIPSTNLQSTPDSCLSEAVLELPGGGRSVKDTNM